MIVLLPNWNGEIVLQAVKSKLKKSVNHAFTDRGDPAKCAKTRQKQTKHD